MINTINRLRNFKLQPNQNIAYLLILIAGLVIHTYSFINLNMNVIDEMQYIFGIKYGMSNSAYPSPIYFIIYSIIGDENGSLKIYARLINLVIFYSAIYPVYKISKKYTTNNLAYLMVVLYIFSPYSWYMNNVMPEILFGTIFYWSIYILTVKNLNKLNLVILAVLLNVLIGVKNHGIFIIPIVLIFMYLEYKKNIIPKWKIIYWIAIFSITKLLFDYYLFGELVIFSKVYASVLSQPINVSYYNILKDLIVVGIGNSIFLAAFFTMPIIYLIISKKYRLNFSMTIFIGYIILLLMTILFSVKVANNPGESIYRVHNRYYSFYTPLLFISTFEIINKIKSIKFIYIIVSSAVLCCLGFLFNKFYILSYIDNADLNSVFQYPILLLLIPIFFIIFNKLASLKFYYVILTIFIITTSLFFMPKSYMYRSTDTPSDFAGKYFCSNKNLNLKDINIYVDSFIDYGFLYFNCPLKYNVNYFTNFDGKIRNNTFYIGNYVYKNPIFVDGLYKISETMYYAE